VEGCGEKLAEHLLLLFDSRLSKMPQN